MAKKVSDNAKKVSEKVKKVSEIQSSSADIDILFETSWEVCNKVGGIYTVLSTKAQELHRRFGDRLVFIGPDVWSAENPSPVFKENKRLLKGASRFLELPWGITVRTGRWDVPGSPIVALVGFNGVYGHLNEVFGQMWQQFGVDSLHAYGDYDEGCAFGVAAAIVMKAISGRMEASPLKTVAHFNEWTTGMGLLYLRSIMPEAASLFTTHATSIGRSICGNGKNLYEYFSGYNGDQMARELNMEAKHSVEKTAAHQADCFTAVSEVTARECAQLLDIRPQVVTPNGFEPDMVPDTRKYKTLRAAARKRLLDVCSLLVGRRLPDDTLIVATSGRNEYRNKGIDLYLDAMARLRSEATGLRREVLALVLTPAWVKAPGSCCDFLTHSLNNEDCDAIACRIRSLGGNSMDIPGADKVTIVDVPCYLDGRDGIVDISYYDILPGLDLTVFPSYYEPWGYTPLESVAFSVPTITTDKAGFGQWVLEECGNGLDESGVEVLPRSDRDYAEDVEKIAALIAGCAAADPETTRKRAEAALKTSRKADWSIFMKHYDEAFAVALNRRDLRLGTKE